MPELADPFVGERPRLLGLAYRILGSRVDAEDVVQEAWLRYQRSAPGLIERPEAWLTTVVTRLSLDVLKSSRRQREAYVGPWLPEPIRTRGDAGEHDPASAAELAESLTFGFLKVLQTLTPSERAAFLLADVFATPYTEIAETLERSPDACRQLASRARRKVRATHVAWEDPGAEGRRVLGEMLLALAVGDVPKLLDLVSDDVVLISDGGARSRAARRPVLGPDRVTRLMNNLARRGLAALRAEVATVNSEPGVALIDGRGNLFMTICVTVRDGRITRLHLVRNPEKLRAFELESPLL